MDPYKTNQSKDEPNIIFTQKLQQTLQNRNKVVWTCDWTKRNTPQKTKTNEKKVQTVMVYNSTKLSAKRTTTSYLRSLNIKKNSMKYVKLFVMLLKL